MCGFLAPKAPKPVAEVKSNEADSELIAKRKAEADAEAEKRRKLSANQTGYGSLLNPSTGTAGVTTTPGKLF